MMKRTLTLATAALALATPATVATQAQAAPAPVPAPIADGPVQVDFSTILFVQKVTLDSSVSYFQTSTVRNQLMAHAEQAGLTVIPAGSVNARHFYVAGHKTDIAAAFGNRIGEPKRYPVTLTTVSNSLQAESGLVFEVRTSGGTWGSSTNAAYTKALQVAEDNGLTVLYRNNRTGSFEVTGPAGAVLEAFAGLADTSLVIVDDAA